MGKLLEMVDMLLVTDVVRFKGDEYDIINRVDRLADVREINVCSILKNVAVDSKHEFLNYLEIIEKVLKSDGTSEKYVECLDKLERLRKIRSSFFIKDRYNFIYGVVNLSDWYTRECSLDEMIKGLDEFKLYDLHYNDDSIYINKHKYMLIDIRKDDCVYKQFISLGNYEKIEGYIGLILARKDGRIEYYRDDVVKSTQDKIKIINEIGLDNINLVITRNDQLPFKNKLGCLRC